MENEALLPDDQIMSLGVPYVTGGIVQPTESRKV